MTWLLEESTDVAAAQRAWVRRVELVAKQQRVNAKFSAKKLLAELPSIGAEARKSRIEA